MFSEERSTEMKPAAEVRDSVATVGTSFHCTSIPWAPSVAIISAHLPPCLQISALDISSLLVSLLWFRSHVCAQSLALESYAYSYVLLLLGRSHQLQLSQISSFAGLLISLSLSWCCLYMLSESLRSPLSSPLPVSTPLFCQSST